MANKVGVTFALFVVLLLGWLPAKGQSVVAEIVGEFPYVYAAADFDSPMIATLKPGSFYYVSKQQFAYGFHKVQIQKNQTAYISSSEIKIVSAEYVKQRNRMKNNPKAAAEYQAKQTEEKEKKENSLKPIDRLRYRGLIIEQQSFSEDTMSKARTEALTFFGYRSTGNNTLFSGEMSTDSSILIHMGAPKYYEQITGYSAGGWILNAHFTFDTLVPLSHNALVSYGFGPMFKYSHFETHLKNTVGTGTTSYTLDDMTLGVLLRLGAGVRWGPVSLRTDIKYYIESHRYLSFNLSTLFVF